MLEAPIVDVTSREFYGEGYDDSDKRIPDMTIIHRQLGKHLTSTYCHVATTLLQTSILSCITTQLNLWFLRIGVGCIAASVRYERDCGSILIGDSDAGWEPSTPLRVLLEVTLRYQHTTYARSVKASMAKVHAQPQTTLRTL